MQLPRSVPENRLLAALPPEGLARLRSELSEVRLERGAVLCEPGLPLSHVHFPTTAVVSLVCSTAGGECLEVATAGSEGLVGLGYAMPEAWTPVEAVVQRSGRALRLPAPVAAAEFARGGALQHLTLRYTHVLMAQMAQAALCSRMHRIDQQLCRWILASLDRSGGDRLDVTQQQVASILGVRREGVSSAVGWLQDAGILHWGRGHLRVADRLGLQANCCDCYAEMRAAALRLFAVNGRDC